jgi:bacteriocin biosynthesis cyclodehydratase domain-containing protein
MAPSAGSWWLYGKHATPEQVHAKSTLWLAAAANSCVLDSSRSMLEAIRHLAEISGVSPPTRPRLAPFLTRVINEDGAVQLRDAEYCFTLRAEPLVRAFLAIEGLLDGALSTEAILDQPAASAIRPAVEFLLRLLTANGLLQESLSAPLNAKIDGCECELAFLSHFSATPHIMLSKLQASKIAIIGASDYLHSVRCALDDVGIGAIVDLASHYDPRAPIGLARRLYEQDCTLLVAALGEADCAMSEHINDTCLATGVRLLRIAFEGTSGLLGPTVVPYHSACLTCLRVRELSNSPDGVAQARFYDRLRDHPPRIRSVPKQVRSIVTGQAAIEIMRLITAFSPPKTVGSFYRFGADDPIATRHPVLKVPGCSDCARMSRRLYR